MKIPYNKPYVSENVAKFCEQALTKNTSWFHGYFANKCLNFFKTKYGFSNSFLTASCTDAILFSALLLDIKQGDEVIIPSFCFVSVANVFANIGATVVLADSSANHPNLNVKTLESLISSKTKAIVFVNYGGNASGIEEVKQLTEKNKIFLIEDAAHGLGAFYNRKRVGSFGDVATFSFHETKNITCGQGGMLVINNPTFITKAHLIAAHGTNKKFVTTSATQKYSWVEKGAEFNLVEIACAILYSQLKLEKRITQKRVSVWNTYYRLLSNLEKLNFIHLPCFEYQNHNGHVFYILVNEISQRDSLLNFLNKMGVSASTHYEPLHLSSFYTTNYKTMNLPNAASISKKIIRLPIYYEIQKKDIIYITKTIENFFLKR